MSKQLRILFAPANRIHLISQVPVARELAGRRHQCAFLARDPVVGNDYKILPHLENLSVATHVYSGYYRTDVNSFLSELRAYRRFRSEFSEYLEGISYDVVITCNDDSALFDRMLLHISRQRCRPTILIQEGVRPGIRNCSLLQQCRALRPIQIVDGALQGLARRFQLGPFFRKGYGQSPDVFVAAAGNSYRQQMIARGCSPSRIRVTGQPRLDSPPVGPPVSRTAEKRQEKILLFCNQPLEIRRTFQDAVLSDLVQACDKVPGTALIFKLHPRDLPPDHWQSLLARIPHHCYVEILHRTPLHDCIKRADAMMTVASTTAIEAMTLGIPVGLINYLPTAWYLPYANTEAALGVDRRSDLHDAIRRLLFDDVLRATLIKNAAHALHEELFLQDGQSAVRIADFVESVAAGDGL